MAKPEGTAEHRQPGPGGVADRPVAPEPRDRWVTAASVGNVLVGAWLTLSPVFLDYDSPTGSAPWNAIIVGLIVLTLAPARAVAPRRALLISWLHVALGAWLLISPFLLGYADVQRALVNEVVAGLLLLLFGVTSALLGGAQRHDRGTGAPEDLAA